MDYFNIDKDSNAVIAITRQIQKKHPFFREKNDYMIKNCIKSIIVDVFEINAICKRICEIEFINVVDVDSAIKYIIQKTTKNVYVSMEYLTKKYDDKIAVCGKLTSIQLDHFAIVNMMADFYGKSTNDYINDISALVNVQFFQDKIPFINCYNAAIKIVQYLTILAVSCAMDILRIVSILEWTEVPDIIKITKNIVTIIRYKNDPISTFQKLCREDKTLIKLSKQFEEKHSNSNVLVDRLMIIYQLYLPSVTKLTDPNLSMTEFKKYIDRTPDYMFFFPTITDQKLMDSVNKKGCDFSLFYLLFDYVKKGDVSKKYILKPLIHRIKNEIITIEI